MKHLIFLFTTILFLMGSIVQAQESQDDLNLRLQAEIDGYISQIDSLQGSELIRVADLITGSGLSDAKLYSAVESKVEVLANQYQANPKEKALAKVLNSMIRTLAAIDPKSEDIIRRMLETSSSRGIRNRAVRLLPKLNWYARRNELMQKPGFYQPGQDLMTSRYLNLITSNDPQMSRWGAEEINRRGSAEQVVYRKMAEVLNKQRLNIRNDTHLDSLAWFCKVLSKFDVVNSAKLLETIRNDANSHRKLKKYSKVK